MFLEYFRTAFRSGEYDVTSTLPYLVVLGSALFCWRIWRFTIAPLMKPSEPKELPYWIPYLGHALSFFQDFNGALENGRKYFENTEEPYSVWLAGKRIYICSSPEDVANLYRNTTTISYHDTVKDMFKWLGVTQAGLDKLFTVDPSAKHNEKLAQPQPPAFMINEYHRRQTKPGELFDDLLHNRTIPEIDEVLEDIRNGNSSSVIEQSTGGVTISLLRMCEEIFFRSTTTSFFGQKIWEVNPHITNSFSVWERTNWKYMFQMPHIISHDMFQARDDIIDTFEKYLSIPETKRQDRNYFATSVEAMMRDVGCNEHDMARAFMLHFWAILGNIYKVAFWTLTHLAYDPSLLASIRAETSLAVKDGHINESHLEANCPLLESLISEVLRLTVAAPLVRDVITPTQIGGKTLQPGSQILVPFRQLHVNNSIWGPDPLTLKASRFVDDPKLYSSKSYRPFGGGQTLCPGRFYAKRSLGYVVATILAKFDIEITSEKVRGKNKERSKGARSTGFPKIDMTKPTPGASLPVEGDDVVLFLRERVPKAKR